MFRAFILVICGCAAIALAACGSDSEEAAYCKQREELQTQITRIRDTDVIKEGTNVFRARVDSALTQAKKLSASAESDFPQETRDLDGAISAVKRRLPRSSSRISVAPLWSGSRASSKRPPTRATACRRPCGTSATDLVVARSRSILVRLTT